MKLRLPQRMSPRTGWIIVACLATPFVLLFVSPFAYVGLSLYWKWHQGYGLACESKTIAENRSPSGHWIAKTRIVTCGGPAGGQWIEAVLVPNAGVPFLVQYKRVFVRDIDNGHLVAGGDRLAMTWKDDHSLELRAVPCVPCRAQPGTAIFPKLCDEECAVTDQVDGISVSLKPAEN